MSLITTISRLASSRQGRRFTSQAMKYAQSPQGKAKIDQARRQLSQRRKPR